MSPVLGFLGAGALLGPHGLSLVRDLNGLDTLGGLGISFLLFEQGLELSLDRLKALSKYAFGLGSVQVVLCTLAFAAFPFLGGVEFLEVRVVDAGRHPCPCKPRTILVRVLPSFIVAHLVPGMRPNREHAVRTGASALEYPPLFHVVSQARRKGPGAASWSTSEILLFLVAVWP